MYSNHFKIYEIGCRFVIIEILNTKNIKTICLFYWFLFGLIGLKTNNDTCKIYGSYLYQMGPPFLNGPRIILPLNELGRDFAPKNLCEKSR